MQGTRGRISLAAVTAALAGALTCAVSLPGCGAASATPPPATPDSPARADLAAGAEYTNQLALDLLARLGGRRNVVFSPYSIETSLAMADQGAASQTEAEIEQVLHAASKAQLANDAKALRSALAGAVRAPRHTPAGDVTRLETANSLWTQAGLALESPFKSTLTNQFGAAPRLVDFMHHPDTARRTINAWVANRTAKIIKDLFPPGAVDQSTRLVLANAIYLKAHWLTPFDPSSTAKHMFTTAGGHTVRVPFMLQELDVPYSSGAGYQAVDLPYVNSSLSMLLIKPTSGSELAFERQLTSPELGRVIASLQNAPVVLRMPRFHVAFKRDLASTLSALGMASAFSATSADFTAITKHEQLAISHVEHGADLKVDEQGTVAAAATGTSIIATSAPGGPTNHLTLDRPFLALLRDGRTGAILFVARIADPSRS